MKRLVSLSAALALVVALASFASGTKEQGAAASASSPVELTLWLGSWWNVKAPLIKAAFEKAYPQYTLKPDLLPINGYFDNAAAAILAGSPPDILDLDITQVATFAAKNLLTDISTDVGGKLNAKDFLKTAWDYSHYKGVMYGMPSRGTGTTFYYNKTMFDEAGVPYPKAGWTLDDMLADAKKITVPGQQKYGVGIAADLSDPNNVWSSFAPVLWANGGEFMNADNTKSTMDTPQAIKAIAFWSELYTKWHVAPEGSVNYTISRDVVPLFQANKVAMLPFGISGAVTFDQTPGLKWGIILPPSGVNRAGGWTLTIPVSAKHKKDAVNYLLWFAQPDVQAAYCATEPSLIAAWAIAAPWNTPNYQVALEAAKVGRALPATGKWSEASTIMIKELQRVLQGQETPEAAGKNMTAQVNSILQ
jgi:multiple sugar transport system substrate-binding protein